MTSLALGFVLIGLLVLLVILGMQIAYALLGVAFLGIWLIRDSLDLAFRMLELTAYSGISDYLFATIPLFVLMGLLVSVSNVGRDTFEVAEVLLKRVVCGLGVATVAANTIFAAVTGVSIASAAVFTRVAVPEMERHGYRAAFASGTVAGSSVLGMLIPPSLLLIIYGVLAEVSIGGMFLAGIIPGLMLAGGFVVMLMGITLLAPGFVFNDPKAARERRLQTGIDMPLREMMTKLMPIVLLVILVLGGLYTGYFTPTEAGGVGAFGAFIVALARRSLDRRKLWEVMKQTGVVSVSILLLLVAASYYSRMLSIAGLPNAIAGLVSDSGFGPTGFILFYAAIRSAYGHDSRLDIDPADHGAHRCAHRPGDWNRSQPLRHHHRDRGRDRFAYATIRYFGFHRPQHSQRPQYVGRADIPCDPPIHFRDDRRAVDRYLASGDLNAFPSMMEIRSLTGHGQAKPERHGEPCAGHLPRLRPRLRCTTADRPPATLRAGRGLSARNSVETPITARRLFD